MLKKMKIVYPLGILLMFAMLMISCSKDRDEESIYNAKLEVSYTGNYIGGNVYYNDANGVKKTLPLRGNMSEKITFNVKKGHQSYVEIDAKDIDGTFKLQWIVQNQSGNQIQNYQKRVTIDVLLQDKTLKDTFQEVVK